MRKQLLATLSALGLALGGLGFGLSNWINVDNTLGRYPGSVRLESHLLKLDSAAQGAFSRQGVYETTDDQHRVWVWYAARLQVSPASDEAFAGSCQWLEQSKPATWLRRTISVLLCAEPNGTRVVVNEAVYLWP